MIPLIVAPLSGLQVLITRPALQAEGLRQRIVALGGTALCVPMLTIQALPITPCATRYDLLIFISANAVLHGRDILAAQPQARLAVIGGATAQALTAAGHAVDVTPAAVANSEALLAHPLLQNPPKHILLVRGSGGRELLHDTLVARGATVAVAEVYARVAHQPDADLYRSLQTQLLAGDLDIISITSVEILQALQALLDAETLAQAQTCMLLLGSARIAAIARQLGWRGEYIIAASPEDTAMIAALTHWYTRARSA